MCYPCLMARRPPWGPCEICGAPEVHIHHRDRDRTNNDRSNLQLLCARCHRIEHLGQTAVIPLDLDGAMKRNGLWMERLVEISGVSAPTIRKIRQGKPITERM